MINPALRFKLILGFSILLLFMLSMLLWLQTPQLFSVFNQAFCSH